MGVPLPPEGALKPETPPQCVLKTSAVTFNISRVPYLEGKQKLGKTRKIIKSLKKFTQSFIKLSPFPSPFRSAVAVKAVDGDRPALSRYLFDFVARVD